MPPHIHYILKNLALAFIAFAMLSIGLFCVVASMMPTYAASPCKLYCQKTPSPTPRHTPPPSPTKKPTPSPTHPPPTPTNTPTATPTNTPTPVRQGTATAIATNPPAGSTSVATSTSGTPIPQGTNTPVAAQTPATPTATPTKQAIVPADNSGNSSGSGGPSAGTLFTYAALALVLAAFLLYLIPQGQSSMLVRLLSLVLPTSLARRFGSK